MTEQGAHHVHLRVGRTGVAALLIDFLQDRRRLLQAQPEAAKGLRNQCRQPAFLRQGLHERLRVFPPRVELAPVGIGKASAQLANLGPELLDVVRIGKWVTLAHNEPRQGLDLLFRRQRSRCLLPERWHAMARRNIAAPTTIQSESATRNG